MYRVLLPLLSPAPSLFRNREWTNEPHEGTGGARGTDKLEEERGEERARRRRRGELKRVYIYIYKERERRIRALPCALRWKRSERGGRKERDAVAREITILAKAKEPKAKGRSVLHVACGTTTTLRR